MPSKVHNGLSALMVWIPADLHQQIKRYCVDNRTTIKEVTITFFRDLVGESDVKGKNTEDSGEDEKK